jgi:hypothetical protein
LRTTLNYRLRDDLQVGVEYNPLADDVGPLVNWIPMRETASRPALILGTSSDRIGTPHGRAFYATLSKDLEGATGLPIAPYAGASFGTFEDELVPVGGLVIRWADRFSTTHLYDGENIHHLATWALQPGQAIGVVAAEQDGEYYLGLAFSTSFGK